MGCFLNLMLVVLGIAAGIHTPFWLFVTITVILLVLFWVGILQPERTRMEFSHVLLQVLSELTFWFLIGMVIGQASLFSDSGIQIQIVPRGP